MGTWGDLPGDVGDAGSKGFEGSWEGFGGCSGLWAPQAEWLQLCWEALVAVLGQLIKAPLPWDCSHFPHPGSRRSLCRIPLSLLSPSFPLAHSHVTPLLGPFCFHPSLNPIPSLIPCPCLVWLYCTKLFL